MFLDLQGMTISKRPYEVNNAFDKYRFAPFVSTVTTNLNPVGLPPIRRDYNLEVEKKIKPESILFSKNRSILKKIEKLKKLEKEVYIENLRKTQQKTEKLREISLRKNKELLKLKQEIDKNNLNSQLSAPLLLCKSGKIITKLPNIENKENQKNENKELNVDAINSNQKNEEMKKSDEINYVNNNHNANDIIEVLKNDPKYIQMKNKLKNREEENLKDLVNFAKSLDFDKYMQELEIKEALNLIKIKVNEEVEQEKLDQEIKLLIENENVDNKNNCNDDTNKIEDITKEEQGKKNETDNVSLFK